MSQMNTLQKKNTFASVMGATAFAAMSFTLTSGIVLADPIIGPQVRADTGGGVEAANETSCATTDVNPNEIVAVWNDWRDSTSSEVINMGVGVSLDGGQTWTDFHVRPPAPNQSGVEGDPMTAYDNRTGTLWVGAISFAGNGGLYVAKKVPGSTSFEPSVQIGQRSFADKCWMVAGPAPGDPNSTMVYIAYNEGLWRSSDMGSTWQGPVAVPSGIGFLPRIAPNGDVFVTYWDFGNGHWIIRSTNGGQSFGSAQRIVTRLDVWSTQDGSRFPGLFRSPAMNTFAIDPNSGDLYVVYPDTTDRQGGNYNVDLYFTKSTDNGANWSSPTIVYNDAGAGDQTFPWLEVDNNGQIHLVYYDSSNTANQTDNNPNGWYDAYYGWSLDGGDTWGRARLTPAPFNSIDDGLNRGSSQFIGDYSGMGVGGDKLYPCYLSNQNGDSDVFVHAITADGASALELTGPVPGQPDMTNSLEVNGAAAGDRITFAYGFSQGSTNVSGCPGLTVDIRNPKIVGQANANGSGTAALKFFVPKQASGVKVRFQAGSRANCEVSNVVVHTF